MDVLMGNTINAVTNYDKAIHAADESEHIHEAEITNKRAGGFCMSQSDGHVSRYHAEAYKLYLQWGAKTKAASQSSTRTRCVFS
eukprot:5931271-Ditylum_brightwellii.AAC.1